MIHATSHSHPIRVDVVPTPGLPGRLGLTFAPGKRATGTASRVAWLRDLDTDLRDLRERFGTDVLVPLLRGYELHLLSIPDLEPRAARMGITVRSFGIDDGSVPERARDAAFVDLIDALRTDLAAGRSVTVHCRGGLGRTGLVAACLLTRQGVAPAEAISTVRRHRPGAIETREQERYVHAFAERGADGDRQAALASSSKGRMSR